MCRQQQTIVSVQSLCICLAFGPWFDMAGTKEALLGNSGDPGVCRLSALLRDQADKAKARLKNYRSGRAVLV
jgi:hypothetical protein